MQRNNQQDADGLTLSITGIRLGGKGLDLREPSEPDTLSELKNARFIDDRTVNQRDGHLGFTVQDASNFSALGLDATVSNQWVYGHGMRVSSANGLATQNAHHPIAGRGKGIFRFREADVVWTGDRLLVMREQEDQPAIGASTFWDRTGAGINYKRGIPAFLPSMVDSTPPRAVTGAYVETCLSPIYRAFIDNDGGFIHISVLDRFTNAVIDASALSGAAGNVEPKIINSGGLLVALWRDSGNQLTMSHWNGINWTTPTVVQTNVLGYDIAVVPGGFHLAWRTATAIVLGKYVGVTAQANPYAFGTSLSLTGASAPAAVGGMALGVSPTGELGVAFMGTATVYMCGFSAALTPDTAWIVVAGVSTLKGISITSRGLREVGSNYAWVVTWGDSAHVVWTQSFSLTTRGTVASRANSEMASNSWRVGDEVFRWVRASNAGTHYLLAGSSPTNVCGFADREEAVLRTTTNGNYGLPTPLPDPLDATGTIWTWCRPFNTGQTYTHGGNVRVGDIDFLPEMVSVQYGRSQYLSGCAVRSWDGETLGDAGWQDYPIIATSTGTTGGTLTALGTYYFLARAVRYNARGERFESASIIGLPVTLTGGQSAVTVVVSFVPDTNHPDAVIEVYRSQAGGTTFYLDGIINNNTAAATGSYVSIQSDVNLRAQVADTHATGVGNPGVIESWGPVGCTMLALSGDRLWGAGGQVPAGFVQFSKLHDDGSGAGFDDLAGFQEVNTEGKAITSVTPLNDATVIFEIGRLYVISGVGPDNFGRGSFDIPQIELADGAINHVGTCSTQGGILYWGQEGPRLLTTQFKVMNVSAPVRPLTEAVEPTGAIVDLSRQEVVWYTNSGVAVLWNYLDGTSRWSEWTGVPAAGVSGRSLITPDGKVLRQDPSAIGDNGQSFEFSFITGNLRPEDILQGGMSLRSVGVVGSFDGPHRLRLRLFYDGSPLWTSSDTWHPEVDTWLTLTSVVGALTPAQVDAAEVLDRSGQYITHRRAARGDCHFFKVAVSNIEADGPTFTPYELSLELAAKPNGLGRTAVATFTK